MFIPTSMTNDWLESIEGKALIWNTLTQYPEDIRRGYFSANVREYCEKNKDELTEEQMRRFQDACYDAICFWGISLMSEVRSELQAMMPDIKKDLAKNESDRRQKAPVLPPRPNMDIDFSKSKAAREMRPDINVW